MFIVEIDKMKKQYSRLSSPYPVYPAHKKTMDMVWEEKDGGNSYP